MKKFYLFISTLSALIRQFLLPNPYINLFDNDIYAGLFNIFIGGYILHKLSYWLTGAGYIRGINNPASGSIGYLLSNIYITTVITLVGKFISNIKIAIIVLVVIYIVSLIVVNKLFNRHINL